jgi:hypothetical protein
LQAKAIPKHKGSATRNTTKPAFKSASIFFWNIFFLLRLKNS